MSQWDGLEGGLTALFVLAVCGLAGVLGLGGWLFIWLFQHVSLVVK